MILHRRTHPVPVEGCFGCRIGSIQVAPSATPSRGGGAHAAHVEATDRSWHRDMAAYKRLRNDGLQPQQIDGSHALERDARSEVEVEFGIKSPHAELYEKHKADLEFVP